MALSTWGHFVLPDGCNVKHMVYKSSHIQQIYHPAQLTFQGRTKATPISYLFITPLTIINQEMLALAVANPDPTETWESFTALALIQTSVAKVCSLSACSLSGQWTKDNEVLPSFCLFARVCAELAFVCNDQLNPIC